MLCAFFKQGQCSKGAKCKFSHDLNIERKGEKINIYSDSRDEKDGMFTRQIWYSRQNMHIFGNISVTVYETVYVDKLTELSSWVGFFLCKEYIWWCFIFRNNGELGRRTAERCGQQETWWTGKNSPQNSYCKLRLTSSTWCALCIIWLIVKQNKKVLLPVPVYI